MIMLNMPKQERPPQWEEFLREVMSKAQTRVLGFSAATCLFFDWQTGSVKDPVMCIHLLLRALDRVETDTTDVRPLLYLPLPPPLLCFLLNQRFEVLVALEPFLGLTDPVIKKALNGAPAGRSHHSLSTIL